MYIGSTQGLGNLICGAIFRKIPIEILGFCGDSTVFFAKESKHKQGSGLGQRIALYDYKFNWINRGSGCVVQVSESCDLARCSTTRGSQFKCSFKM